MIAVGLGGLVLFLLLLLFKKRTAAKETLKTFASFELLLGAEISTLAHPLHPLSPSDRRLVACACRAFARAHGPAGAQLHARRAGQPVAYQNPPWHRWIIAPKPL